jgi:hypothetical protein
MKTIPKFVSIGRENDHDHFIVKARVLKVIHENLDDESRLGSKFSFFFFFLFSFGYFGEMKE